MTVTIEFDKLSPGTAVSDQYRAQGIIFTTKGTIAQNPETFTHGLLPEVVARPTEFGVEHQNVIRARLPAARHGRIALDIGSDEEVSQGTHATLLLYDATDSLLEKRTFGNPGPEAHVEIETIKPHIASFELSGLPGQFDRLDKLTFDVYPEPDFRLLYDATNQPLRIHAGSQDVGRARIDVFRLHGSTGEILLSVTEPVAGTTWSFDPPLLHSGVPHVDLTIKSGEQATPGEHSVEVIAVPRHAEAGKHERTVSIPVHVFPERANHM